MAKAIKVTEALYDAAKKERIGKYQKKINEKKRVIRSLTDKLANPKKSKKTTSKT